MKKHLFSIIIILSGFYYYSEPQISETKIENKRYEISYDEMKVIDTGFNFLDIFLNNLIVGLILSIFGFLSGGLITIIVLFWNGYILSIIFNLALNLLETIEILYYSKHIPIEIIGLILLSSIGFKGFLFYKEVFFQKKINLKIIPKSNEFILPVSLLFIASIIETL
jgi:uncharacterized membrane protein SpoIIM required for sporulation